MTSSREMTESPPSVDKSPQAVRDMFAGVAPRYDLLNHLLTGNLDFLWRRRATAALKPRPGERILDLCSGTGDQALGAGRRGARVAAADFCVPMLALSRAKFAAVTSPGPWPLAADALALPFSEGRFAGATVSFGLRNVSDLDAALRQLATSLQAGGRLVVLEFALPENRLLRGLYLAYFQRVLPFIGRLVSPRGSAYKYLPDSVVGFPQRQEFLDHMAAAGFENLTYKNLAGGTVCLYRGTT
ncbi:MAG: ubiquinone/menaquinone biosynthesis methyltransferase [Acidobacteriota bacterium]